jgi:DNA-binding CsgD family transcriptional regulator
MDLPITLSDRELQIALELLKFLPSKDIGENLFITEKTVKFHITRLFKKCGVTKRGEFFKKYSSVVIEENKIEIKKKPIVDDKDALPIGENQITLD